MGNSLPKPVLSKVIDRAGGPHVAVGCCGMNGFRPTMEDAHMLEITNDRMMFGIFDGHSGDTCSRYLAEHLPGRLKNLSYPPTVEQLEKLCLDLDAEYMEEVKKPGGSTATFVIIFPSAESGKKKLKAYVCNVGDSRTLLIRDQKLLFETVDHKPSSEKELHRIVEAGGIVRMDRVGGDLALSRAFGDASFKSKRHLEPREQMVIPVPDVSELDIEPGDTMILSCDGVYEGAFSSEDVANFVGLQLPKCDGDYGVVAAQVCDEALRRTSKDNISCMVVHFSDGSEIVKKFGKVSLIPGSPYPKNSHLSRTAYENMAVAAGMSLPEALQLRYKLLMAFKNKTLSSQPLMYRIAFDLQDDVDISLESNFFGMGPVPGNEEKYFQHLASAES